MVPTSSFFFLLVLGEGILPLNLGTGHVILVQNGSTVVSEVSSSCDRSVPMVPLNGTRSQIVVYAPLPRPGTVLVVYGRGGSDSRTWYMTTVDLTARYGGVTWSKWVDVAGRG